MDSSYKEVLDFLYQQLPMFQRQGASAFKKDLTNIIALCDSLYNPQEKFTSIHIAGTNGKGSVTHILSSIFQSAGYKVGVYTSPHYLDLRERIKIGNKLIPKQTIVDFIDQVKPQIEIIKPSFFELMVAMAFQYFADQKVDIAIIETGLGGRLDSTNIIRPALSVITNISYDHQDMLGDTLPEIAGEKAGIIKVNVPVIIGQTQAEIASVFTGKAMLLKSPIVFADQLWKAKVIDERIDQSIVNLYKNDELVYQNINYDLKGEIMLKNLVTSIGAIDLWNAHYSPIANEAIMAGLSKIKKQTYFIGRMQVLQSSDPIIIADSAHNEDGLKALFAEVNKIKFENLHIVFGMVSDKPLSKVLKHLPKEAFYYAVAARIPRAKSAEVLKDELKKAGYKVQIAPSVEKGKKMAISEANSQDLVLICGSIFVVAEISEIALSLDS